MAMRLFIRIVGFTVAVILSWSVRAQGVGTHPAVQNAYPAGIYGLPATPTSPDYLSFAPIAQGCSWTPTYGAESPQNIAYPEASATADGFVGASGNPTMGSCTPELTYCKTSLFQSLKVSSNNMAIRHEQSSLAAVAFPIDGNKVRAEL